MKFSNRKEKIGNRLILALVTLSVLVTLNLYFATSVLATDTWTYLGDNSVSIFGDDFDYADNYAPTVSTNMNDWNHKVTNTGTTSYGKIVNRRLDLLGRTAAESSTTLGTGLSKKYSDDVWNNGGTVTMSFDFQAGNRGIARVCFTPTGTSVLNFSTVNTNAVFISSGYNAETGKGTIFVPSTCITSGYTTQANLQTYEFTAGGNIGSDRGESVKVLATFNISVVESTRSITLTAYANDTKLCDNAYIKYQYYSQMVGIAGMSREDDLDIDGTTRLNHNWVSYDDFLLVSTPTSVTTGDVSVKEATIRNDGVKITELAPGTLTIENKFFNMNTNGAENPFTGKIIIAKYGENNKLTDLDMDNNFTITSFGETKIENTISVDEEDVSLKVMLWNNMDDIYPIVNFYKINKPQI